MESLTDEVEKRAWDYIERIDRMGGMLKAVKEGFVQREIADSSLEHQKQVDSGKRTVVGLNKYVINDHEEPPKQLKVDSELIERQINRTRNLKEKRDPDKANDAIKNLRDAALDSDMNVFEAVIDAVKAHITNGEIVGELRKIYGFGRPLLI